MSNSIRFDIFKQNQIKNLRQILQSTEKKDLERFINSYEKDLKGQKEDVSELLKLLIEFKNEVAHLLAELKQHEDPRVRQRLDRTRLAITHLEDHLQQKNLISELQNMEAVFNRIKELYLSTNTMQEFKTQFLTEGLEKKFR